MAQGQKVKTFESGITQLAITRGIIPVVVALWLIWNGTYYSNKFPGSEHVGLLLLFSVLPLVFGLAILVVAAGVVIKNLGQKVTITPDAISYEHGKEQFAVRWEMLAFSAPPPGKKTMRALSISDGSRFARIEELFFPDFSTILQIVTQAKQKKSANLEL